MRFLIHPPTHLHLLLHSGLEPRQASRQAVRQAGRLADRQACTQASRKANRQADRQTDRQAGPSVAGGRGAGVLEVGWCSGLAGLLVWAVWVASAAWLVGMVAGWLGGRVALFICSRFLRHLLALVSLAFVLAFVSHGAFAFERGSHGLHRPCRGLGPG